MLVATSRDVLTGVASSGKVLGMATGMDLKLRRIAARVQVKDLARQMGRSRATLHRYEGLMVVPADIADDYLKALDDVTDVATTATPAEAVA